MADSSIQEVIYEIRDVIITAISQIEKKFKIYFYGG